MSYSTSQENQEDSSNAHCDAFAKLFTGKNNLALTLVGVCIDRVNGYPLGNFLSG